jgi:hypothetical protein
LVSVREAIGGGLKYHCGGAKQFRFSTICQQLCRENAKEGTTDKMNCRLVLSVALFLLPVAISAQTTNDKIESGTARARLLAARNAASAVTAQQCLADISSWNAKDDADEKANVKDPSWWYQKLSTEELVRLSSESTFCMGVLRHAHRVGDSRVIGSYGRMFYGELLDRAEALLAEHHLMHEYLLKSSE